MNEIDHLKDRVERLQNIYNACNPGELKGYSRMWIEAWLGEVGLQLERLRRDVVRLTQPPPPTGTQAIWSRYSQVFAALSPVSETIPEGTPAGDMRAGPGLLSVARRLGLVMRFLYLQVAGAISLLGYSVYLLNTFDPQVALTSEQFEARRLVKSHVTRIERIVDAEAAAAAARPAPVVVPVAPANASPSAPIIDGPDASALRGEIEGLAASLEDLRLVKSDILIVNSWLQVTLAAIDRDPPDYVNAKSSLEGLQAYLRVDDDARAPSLITLTVLGSLLGMIIITSHLNWKFRNRWDTVGFIPWYITKLVGAPVLSIAAVGFLSQFSMTKNINEVQGFGELGLIGRDSLFIFSVAILTGLFSNRVFDWLKEIVQGQPSPPPAPGSPSTESTETAERKTENS